jgi:hypothetical protein
MTDEFATPERFRADLRDALLVQPEVSVRRAPARPRLPRVTVRLGTAAALAATIAAVVLALSSGGALQPQPATAAGVLRASADALQRTGAAFVLGRGDYFYSRVATWFRYAGAGRRTYVVRSVDEQWMARNGSGRERRRVLSHSRGPRGAGDPTRSADERLRAAKRPFVLSTLPAPGIALSYTQLRRLPAGADRLSAELDRIEAAHRMAQLFPSRQWQTALMFGVLRGLAQAPAPSGVRAALYRALASTPGIRLLGRRVDSVGRTGTGVAVRLGALTLTLIIDQATGELLQTSRTLTHRSHQMPGQPPGLVNRATFLVSAVVGSTDARPR